MDLCRFLADSDPNLEKKSDLKKGPGFETLLFPWVRIQIGQKSGSNPENPDPWKKCPKTGSTSSNKCYFIFSTLKFSTLSFLSSSSKTYLKTSFRSSAGNLLIWILSESLVFVQTIAHFLWAIWANCSWSLIFVERPERFAHIVHLIWAKSALHSHRSPKKRKWAKISNSLIFSIKQSYIL